MNFESMMNDREARLRSPTFQAEMAREKAEFETISEKLRKEALDLGYNSILKVPAKHFSNAMKMIYDKKYGMKAYSKESFKMFFGKKGVGHGILKTGAAAIHLTGKTVKIGLRQLFAK